MTNPIFLLKLVRASTDECCNTENNSFHDDSSCLSSDDSQQDTEHNKEENLIHKFKEMLCGLNDHTIKISDQVKVHKRLTLCYFEFIREMVADYVPKRIQHKMVNLVLENFEDELNEKVFSSYVINQSFNEVLIEEKGIVEDRERVEQMLFAVNKALKSMVDIQCF